jgi:hypothetical protein
VQQSRGHSLIRTSVDLINGAFTYRHIREELIVTSDLMSWMDYFLQTARDCKKKSNARASVTPRSTRVFFGDYFAPDASRSLVTKGKKARTAEENGCDYIVKPSIVNVGTILPTAFLELRELALDD